jgi:hypothetical protein
LAVVTFAASFAQIRLQSVVSAEKDAAFRRYEIQAEERMQELRLATATAHERTAELERETVAARLELQILQAHQAQRSITPDQHDRILEALSGVPAFRVNLLTLRDDPEARWYAEDIERTLRDAGLQAGISTPLEAAVGLGLCQTGPPDDRAALAQAFAHAGLPLAPAGHGFITSAAEIVVGSRAPLPPRPGR